MNFVSFLMLLQVVVFTAVPALARMSETACCVTICEEAEAEEAGEEHHGDAAEQCNPFACAGCCVLVLAVPPFSFEKSPELQNVSQQSFITISATLQPQHTIWHPPKIS